jgi:hypothetical protein
MKFLPESIQYVIGSYLIPKLNNITISKHFYKGTQNNKHFLVCFICNKLNKCLFINSYYSMCIKCCNYKICNNCNNFIFFFFENTNQNVNNNNYICERCSIYDFDYTDIDYTDIDFEQFI